MATTLTPPKPALSPPRNGGGHDGNGSGGWSGGPGPDAYRPRVPGRAYRTGMWMGLAAVVMLFAAFTSAMVVRRGASTDWVPTRLPGVIFLNTLLLLGSSLTLEISRRSFRRGLGQRFVICLYATLGLGLAFVAGQFLAWRELAARGVYLATNPSSSFFYVLTAAHGLHVFGGIIGLAYLVWHSRELLRGSARPTSLEVTATYWHFMDGLWVYILFLLIARV